MSSPRTILQKDYSEGRAIADVKIAVINPDNFRQITFEKKAKIDTGFDAGFHIQESEMSQLAPIGVRPAVGPITLAGNIPATAYHCFGYLQKIGDYELPPPGIEITLVFQGTRPQGLLGLEAISNWVVTFDGPAQSFKITCK
jgi:hypothetical protein